VGIWQCRRRLPGGRAWHPQHLSYAVPAFLGSAPGQTLVIEAGIAARGVKGTCQGRLPIRPHVGRWLMESSQGVGIMVLVRDLGGDLGDQ
jgi:hypothetical protein